MNELNWDDLDEYEKPNLNNKVDTSYVDWDLLESDNPTNQEEKEQLLLDEDPIYHHFKAPDYSPEELKNMSWDEKTKYAQQLKEERDYVYGKRRAKSFMSGATLGISESVPGMEIKPGEESMYGSFVGSMLPISASAKIVGFGVKYLPKVPDGLKWLSRIGEGFAVGSLYGTGKETVKAAQGKGFSIKEIALEGGIGAAFQGLVEAGSLAARSFKQLPPGVQAKILETGVIPEGLPKSQYETAEEFLSQVKTMYYPHLKPSERPSISPKPQQVENPNSLAGRISRDGEDIGLRPSPIGPGERNISNEVGNVISPVRFENSTQGGHSIQRQIQQIDSEVYEGVNELYRLSREANREIVSTQPELLDFCEQTIHNIDQIPSPSSFQESLRSSARDIRNRLATFRNVTDEAGNIIGQEIEELLPINSQDLIDQIQALRQKVDFNFAHGDSNNILRPLINEIQQTVLNTAETMNPEAAELFNEARAGYRVWTETFNNPYIRKWRNNQNRNHSDLYNSSLKLDNSRNLSTILQLTEEGNAMLNASRRDLVEKTLNPYIENPSLARGNKYEKDLRELRAIFPEEEIEAIDSLLRSARREQKPRFRGKYNKPPEVPVTKEQKAWAKYENKQPEDIQKMLKSRSGIKELRSHAKTEGMKKTLDDMLKQEMRSILRQKNIEKDFTGNDLYKTLNNEHNYEIFSEILGETETENLRLAAKEIGKKQMSQEARSEFGKKILNKYAAFKSLKILLGVF